MNNLRAGLRFIYRDLRSGELNLLLASLIISVGSVSTITLFSDRLDRALKKESSSFLAADLVVSSDQPIKETEALFKRAKTSDIKSSNILSFMTMMFYGEKMQLVSVKAVDDFYPLRGKLLSGNQPFGAGMETRTGPMPGEIWLESRLFPALGLKINETVELGSGVFKISKVLVRQPDSVGGYGNVAPRVLIHSSDVERTRVIQPGSRVNYRYLFSGEPSKIEKFQEDLGLIFSGSARVLNPKNVAEGLGDAIERGEKILLLGSLLTVMLSGLATFLSANRYVNRHNDHIAILKTLGASPRFVKCVFFAEFSLVALIVGIFGCLLGYFVQDIIFEVASPVFSIDLPEPGPGPLMLAFIMGFFCLFSFAFFPIMELSSTEPVRVLRRNTELYHGDWRSYFLGAIGIFGLMWTFSSDLRLTMILYFGVAFAITIFLGIVIFMVRSSTMIGIRAGNLWRLALSGMRKRLSQTCTQILVFGLAMMMFLVLYLLRTSLLEDWETKIPNSAPNHFVINISEDEINSIVRKLADSNIKSREFYPLIRGSVTHINGVSTKSDKEMIGDERGDVPRAEEARNLTWTSVLPEGNALILGEWWPEDYDGPPLVSIEEDFANRNNLTLQDELTLEVQGSVVRAHISNIRSVDWNNFQPNFFVIFSPGTLEKFSPTYMTSFFLKPEQKIFLNALLSLFPTLTVLEADKFLENIKQIVKYVALAIEFLLALLLAAALAVLVSSLYSSMDERIRQHSILRALGASRKTIIGSLLLEFQLIGFLSGLIACVGAQSIVYFLDTQLFEVTHYLDPYVWVTSPLLGSILVSVLGIFIVRHIVFLPPSMVLTRQ